MLEFDAVFYDGKTSARRAVKVRALSHHLHISGPEVDQVVELGEVSVDEPLPGAPRSLRLPGDAQLQTGDHAAVEALFPEANRLESWVHGLERRWRYALGAVVVIALFSWWVIVDGVPLAARIAAGFVPASLEAQLGAQTLGAVDQALCKASKLEPARQRALRERFALLTAGVGDGYDYRLELRSCSIGPNAFALPGGTIVLTDQLVKLAQNDEQVAAVLAHEIGHVRHRHGLRLGLQAAGVAALSAALLGDAVSITNLAIMLPSALLQSGYSREFETEADDYAFRRLRQISISPRAFAEMMELLEKEHRKRSGASMDYFATHPATAKRIERALNAAGP
jgi:Zn-dependent protease with chaperone function